MSIQQTKERASHQFKNKWKTEQPYHPVQSWPLLNNISQSIILSTLVFEGVEQMQYGITGSQGIAAAAERVRVTNLTNWLFEAIFRERYPTTTLHISKETN